MCIIEKHCEAVCGHNWGHDGGSTVAAFHCIANKYPNRLESAQAIGELTYLSSPWYSPSSCQQNKQRPKDRTVLIRTQAVHTATVLPRGDVGNLIRRNLEDNEPSAVLEIWMSRPQGQMVIEVSLDGRMTKNFCEWDVYRSRSQTSAPHRNSTEPPGEAVAFNQEIDSSLGPSPLLSGPCKRCLWAAVRTVDWWWFWTGTRIWSRNDRTTLNVCGLRSRPSIHAVCLLQDGHGDIGVLLSATQPSVFPSRNTCRREQNVVTWFLCHAEPTSVPVGGSPKIAKHAASHGC